MSVDGISVYLLSLRGICQVFICEVMSRGSMKLAGLSFCKSHIWDFPVFSCVRFEAEAV